MKVFRHHDDKRRTKNLGRTFLMVFEKETRHVFKGEELHPSTQLLNEGKMMKLFANIIVDSNRRRNFDDITKGPSVFHSGHRFFHFRNLGKGAFTNHFYSS